MKQAKITIRFLQYIQTNSRLRGASRLFFCMRLHAMPFGGVLTHERYLQFIEGSNFTKYQVETYMKTLRTDGWIGVANDGAVFIRSLRMLMDRVDAGLGPNGGPLFNKNLDDFISDEKIWRSLLKAVCVLSVARNLVRTTHPGGTAAGSIQVDGGSSVSASVALEVLSNSLSISKSTASRWRKEGADAGYYSLREDYTIIGTKEITTSKFDRNQDYWDDNPNKKKLIQRRKRLAIQNPSIIVACFSTLMKYSLFLAGF